MNKHLNKTLQFPGEKKLSFSRLLLALLVFFSLGCAATQPGDVTILESMEAGLSAFSRDSTAEAMSEFLSAAESIDQVWANTEDAERARSLFHDESEKKFKGEPYERVMVFHYLGLNFISQEDYGNAQAAFRAALLQASVAEKEEDRFNFEIGLLLGGLCLDRLGSTGPARDMFREYETLTGRDLPFDRDQLPNVILVVDTGVGPKKTTQEDKSVLAYIEQEVRAPVLQGQMEEQSIDQLLVQSTYELALGRGMREADKLNLRKKTVKKVGETAGKVSQEVGELLLRSGDENTQTLGLAMLLAGAAGEAVSSQIKTQADTRYWANLPGRVHIGFGYIAEEFTSEPINFTVTSSQEVFQKTIKLKPDQLNLVYFSDRLR